MIDVEHELRQMLRHDADAAPPPNPVPPIRRAHRRQRSIVVATSLVALALAASIVVAVRNLPGDGVVAPAANATLPTGPLASLEVQTPEGTVALRATGTAEALCLRVTAPTIDPIRSCWTPDDLGTIDFEPQYATLGGTGHAIVFGLTSKRATSVEFDYAGGGRTDGRLAELRGVRPQIGAFLLVAEKAIVRAALVAKDAQGTTVGEPYWSVWGEAPGNGISCTCENWLKARNASA